MAVTESAGDWSIVKCQCKLPGAEVTGVIASCGVVFNSGHGTWGDLQVLFLCFCTAAGTSVCYVFAISVTD